jgi:hypothetical protein
MTWNGKRPVYILDEDEQILDMVTRDEVSAQTQPIPARNRNQEKRRRKLARRSRKRNSRQA